MELTSMETTTPQWSVQDVISTLSPNHMTTVTGLDCQNVDAAALAQTLQSLLATSDPSVFASQMQLMQAVTGNQTGGNQVMLMPQPDGLQWMMHQYPMMFVPSWSVPTSAEALSSGDGVQQSQPPLYAQAVQLQFPEGLQIATAAQQTNPEFRNGSSVSASPVPKASTSNSPVPIGIAMNQHSVQLVNGAIGLGQQQHVQLVQPSAAVVSQLAQQPSAQTDTSTYNLPVGYTVNRQEPSKPELPKPPKKPLSPYMSFSKAIWSKVKGANPSMSVCEVGAAIGRLWRELDDAEKQRYNHAFTDDKTRYDQELQAYLKMTGLQASDLVKPRTKKNHPKPPAPVAQQPRPAITAVTVPISQPQQQPQQQAPSEATLGAPGEMSTLAEMARALPHFSQVWTGQQPYLDQQMLAQLGQALFTNCDGTINFVGLQPQTVNIPDERQMTAILYGQNQDLSQPTSNPNQQPTTTDLEKVTGASSTPDAAMTQLGTGISWQWHTLATEGNSSSGQLSSTVQPAGLQVNEQGLTRTLVPRVDSEAKVDGGSVAGQSPAMDTGSSVGPSESQWNQLEPNLRMSLLEKELLQMRAALSEKTQEAQLLMQQLEQANRIIEQLQRRRTEVRSTEPSST